MKELTLETLIAVWEEMFGRGLFWAMAVIAALAWPEVSVDGADLSPQALEVARINIERHHLRDRVHLHISDGLSALPGPYDLIFVTLKSTQLEAAAADIVSRLSPDGAMVMIQNGLPWWYFEGIDSPFAGSPLPCLDPSGRLRSQIPLARVVGAVIYRPVTQIAPGKIFLPEIMPPRLWPSRIGLGE